MVWDAFKEPGNDIVWCGVCEGIPLFALLELGTSEGTSHGDCLALRTHLCVVIPAGVSPRIPWERLRNSAAHSGSLCREL